MKPCSELNLECATHRHQFWIPHVKAKVVVSQDLTRVLRVFVPALDEALARGILSSLADVDRDAISRFYTLGQTADQIEKALGLEGGYVQRLKRVIKVRFLVNGGGL